jgi:CubicO group peptidase (beta-lactamase class C family)
MPAKGFVAAGWEPVKKVFDAILEDPQEGGQITIYHKGKKVVDIYGGPMDATATVPCTPTTLSQIYSATKGAGAMMVAMLVGEGKINIDEPVAKYWPEFAQNGKDKITVRKALSHQSGLHFNEVNNPLR